MRTVLLCAGDIGFQAAEALLAQHADHVAGIATYEVEPPQDVFLPELRDLAARFDLPFFDLTGRTVRGLAGVWEQLQPDCAVVIKWRTLIDPAILAATAKGVVVFHSSLLPKYRGFAPIPWPLINGETETGVTMFYAVDGVDAGDIIEQRAIAITPEDDAGTLLQKVGKTVASMLSDVFPDLIAGTAPRRPQNHADATYCTWRRPEDGEIDWSRSAVEIHNLVRGLTHPYPGAFTWLRGQKLFVWRTSIFTPQRRYVGIVPGKVEIMKPGEVVSVLAGDGLINLIDVQLDGAPPQPGWEAIDRLYTRLGS